MPVYSGLDGTARKAVLQKRRSKGAPWWKRLMLKQPVRSLLAKQMRAKTAEKVREDHYPAPYRLIDLFEQYGDDPARMRTAETEIFAPLMASDTSRNLRRVFMLSEMLKDEAPKNGFKPKFVHVVGAGAMGGDIAAWCANQGMRVTLADMKAEPIAGVQVRVHRLRPPSRAWMRLRCSSPAYVSNARIARPARLAWGDAPGSSRPTSRSAASHR